MSLRLFVLWLGMATSALTSSAWAQPPLTGPVTPQQAAAAAANAAPPAATVRGFVSINSQQANVGTYSPGGNEGLFQGGMGNANPQGTTRKAGCAPNSDDPECWAIITMQAGRALPSTWVPPNSHQLVGRDAIAMDPTTVLGYDPLQAVGAQTNVQCQTTTRTTPEVREQRHCYDTTPNVPLTCSLGLEIEVDPDFVYQCLIVLATNSSLACSVGQVITVDANTTYECVERIRSNQSNACSVSRTIEVDAETQYVCVQELQEAITTTCSVGAVVEVRADTVYQCVEQVRTVANAGCTVGQQITIDPRYQYECQRNPNQITTNQCSRRLIVTCSAGACGPQMISAPALPDGVTMEVNTDWPTSNQTLVRIDAEYGLGTPGFAGYESVTFDLVVQGTVENPSYALIGHTDVDSTLSINGQQVVAWTPAGFPLSPTTALTTGVNRLVFVYKITPGLEVPFIVLQLKGNFCSAATCTDTWDATECQPYVDRL